MSLQRAKTEADIAFAISMGHAIREARHKRGIKAEALALEMGVSVKSLSSWENGHALPSLPYLLTLAHHFEIDAWKLLRDAQTMHLNRQVFDGHKVG